jgi:hypothetical protein
MEAHSQCGQTVLSVDNSKLFAAAQTRVIPEQDQKQKVMPLTNSKQLLMNLERIRNGPYHWCWHLFVVNRRPSF